MAKVAVGFAKALAALKAHRRKGAPADMRRAFARDPRRFEKFSASLDDLVLDYSKCAVDARALDLLDALAKAADVAGQRAAMFAGQRINLTEKRAVLHWALRSRADTPVMLDGRDVMPDVEAALAAMAGFAQMVRSGAFSDVVNIGIGGSDLGPAMAVAALVPYHDGPRVHFVSNVDGAHLADTLKRLDPAKTLFLIASKTFTTVETMANAASARRWIVDRLGAAAVAKHFAAISTAGAKAMEFGIAEDKIFAFWDWVGGRYSVWSAIGLPLMIAVGPLQFLRFLEGGAAMDRHFREAPTRANLPMLMGLLGVWHRNICRYASRAVVPYDQRLARFPAFLQQLDMESNGKGVMRTGRRTTLQTGPVVWGEPGTNGQHAFFQWLHQGSDVAPVEFLVAAQSHEGLDMTGHHALLLANCLAQSKALMQGRDLREAAARLLAAGHSKEEARRLAPHRAFPGNRPSLTLAYRKLDPHTLGRLIALYEHRVFVEAAIWNINAFDQWGVELGKELASSLQAAVEGRADDSELDSSTAGLVRHLRGLA